MQGALDDPVFWVGSVSASQMVHHGWFEDALFRLKSS
jgi:hypothetical protein